MNTGNKPFDLLSVRGLTVAYPLASGPVPVLRSLDLSLGRGEIVGVMGPSGSGKTTLALAILRLLPAGAILAGEIRFNGVNLLELPGQELLRYRGRRIGLVFQEPESAFNPLISVGHQLAEAVRFHFSVSRQAAWDEIAEALAELGGEQPHRLLHSYPRQLSVGELQRVQLAGALACRPELLICDEPTAAVDARNRLRLLDHLATVRQTRKLSLLVISHDPRVLNRLADRLERMPFGDCREETR